MLMAVVNKEVFESIYRHRFIVLLMIAVTLIPMGLYVNEVNYSSRLSGYNDQVRLQAKTVASAQVWDLLSGTVPIKGFLEPAPLAVFAQGLETSLPQSYGFKPRGSEKGASLSGERTISSTLGELDFSFMVQLVFTLIALVFGAEVVSGEKEAGTLRMVFSNSVPRDIILLGKLIGGYAAIWFPFAIAFTAGIFVLGFTSFPLYQRDVLLRILLIFVSSSAFILIYFSIGIAVSTSTAEVRTSLIATVAVWTFLQLIVPQAGGMLATLFYPIKPETMISVEKNLTINNLENKKAIELGSSYQRIFGIDTAFTPMGESSSKEIEWDSVKDEVTGNYASRMTSKIDSINEECEREKAIQQNIQSVISLFSPGVALHYIITDLCNTGASDEKRYLKAVKIYQGTIEKELFDMVERTTLVFPSGRSAAFVSIKKVPVPSSLPQFSVQRAGLPEILIENAVSIISLTLWLIVPLAVAYSRFFKYDVR